MNEVLSYIDDFFKGNPGPMEKQEFEKRLKEDPAFAEEVAFYVATINVLRDDAKSERRERYRNFKSVERSDEVSEVTNVRTMRNSRRTWMYAAASALVLLMAGYLFIGDKSTPQEMCNRYVETNFQSLGVHMDASGDSIEIGRGLFKAGKLDESLQIFLDVEKRNSDLSELKKYIGIVYLRQGQYEKALEYFRQLEAIKGLQYNYGVFYQAITLLKRNQPGDSALARKLLDQVDELNLAGSDEARKWLKKF